jgi:probable HAF family extracellular repeat protein
MTRLAHLRSALIAFHALSRLSRIVVPIGLVAAIVLKSSTIAAVQPSFMGLGDLPGGDFYSVARDASADGSVVIGTSKSAAGEPWEAFRWTKTGGMIGLGDLAGGMFVSSASGISANGLVTIGSSHSASGEPSEAYRWTQAEGMVGLGDLPGGLFYSASTSVSSDGATVVGCATSEIQCNTAFRWTMTAGMVDLGFQSASGISASGSVIVGQGQIAGVTQAIRWTEADGAVGLGSLPDGNNNSFATSVSADGTVVVGSSSSASGDQAFRWTQTQGMTGLGHLPGGIYRSQWSTAVDVSPGGTVVVGSGTTEQGEEAFVWDATNGMRRVADVLERLGLQLNGWILREALAVSAHGVIVGWGTDPSANTEAWIAVIPEISESDTDNDGLSDSEEINFYATDPLDPDSDKDGLSDGDEVTVYATDALKADTDSDGLTDGGEVNTFGTNPIDADSDDDGLNDGQEVNTYATDPLNPDTDSDGYSDGEEVAAGTDPNQQGSSPYCKDVSGLLVLDRDIDACSLTSDAILDLNGHTVRYIDAQGNYRVKVRNGNVSRVDHGESTDQYVASGINFIYCNDCVLENVRVHNSAGFGGENAVVELGSRNVVDGCIFEDNPYDVIEIYWGYGGEGEPTAIVRNSIFARNDGWGILIDDAVGAIIESNRFIANRDSGVIIWDEDGFGASDNVISTNVFERNRFGVSILVSNDCDDDCLGVQANNRIVGNLFQGNSGSGITFHALSCDRGDYPEKCESVSAEVESNVFIGNGLDAVLDDDLQLNAYFEIYTFGILLDDGVTLAAPLEARRNVTIKGNVAVGNGDLGIDADSAIDASGNEAEENGDPRQCIGVACGQVAQPTIARVEVYNTDLSPDNGFVERLRWGDKLNRAEVGDCPGFHTVTTGPRNNSSPESLAGIFDFPTGSEIWNETSQPYCWTGDVGWYSRGDGIPKCTCREPLASDDGAFSIALTPYDGELVNGEPTGTPGIEMSVDFSIETLPLEVTRIEVYNSERPEGQQFVKVLENGDVLSRGDVGGCPAFHTVTTGARNNASPESLEGDFSTPSASYPWNEENQPYCWPADQGWSDGIGSEPVCACDPGRTGQDGEYSITVTPYDGELVSGEPTGTAGQGKTVTFYVPEPSRWLLLAAGLGVLLVMGRVSRRS